MCGLAHGGKAWVIASGPISDIRTAGIWSEYVGPENVPWY